jgi:hypothetical protein
MLLSKPEPESFRVQVLRLTAGLDRSAVSMGQHHHVFYPQVKKGVIEGGRYRRIVGPGKVSHVPENEKLPGPGIENVFRNDPAVGTCDDESVRSLPGAEGAIGVPVGPAHGTGVSLKKSVSMKVTATFLEMKSFPYLGSGRNWREAELMQYRIPVGGGPSLNRCPRWASQRAHRISVRIMP